MTKLPFPITDTIYRTNAKPQVCLAQDTRWISRLLHKSGYVCTELLNHEGDHIAGGDPTPIIHQWKNNAKS